jgi:O-succinylbenzoate synthase
MEMKPNTSRVLMSDVLKGQVPDFDEEVVEQLNGKHVILVAEVHVGAKTQGVTGLLRGVMFGANPEVEFRLDLEEALSIIEAQGLSFGKFELHHGERIVALPGPFVVVQARIDDISAQDQLCTMWLQLKRPAR